MVRFQVHMILLETSSVCFCFAWFARNFDCNDSYVRVMEFCFTLTFFLFRILHLSFVLYALKDVLLSTYPMLSLIFAPLLVLQFYWFFLIVTYTKKPKKKDWMSFWSERLVVGHPIPMTKVGLYSRLLSLRRKLTFLFLIKNI